MPTAERDVRRLAAWSAREKAPLLTTLKDYVKLSQFVGSLGGIAGFEPSWVDLSLEFVENEKVLWDAVDTALRRQLGAST